MNDTIKFKRERTFSGVASYRHLGNMDERLRLMVRVKAGEITLTEAQRRAKKLPLVFRQDQLPANAEIVE